ncbi:hypothetical protein TNCV_2587271 [Trichonephila clavipes]|nr:hypothetical protein TNCV_2587271 [Trichonephila clavipes]
MFSRPSPFVRVAAWVWGEDSSESRDALEHGVCRMRAKFRRLIQSDWARGSLPDVTARDLGTSTISYHWLNSSRWQDLESLFPPFRPHLRRDSSTRSWHVLRVSSSALKSHHVDQGWADFSRVRSTSNMFKVLQSTQWRRRGYFE